MANEPESLSIGPPPDLKAIPTMDLMKELLARADHGVIGLIFTRSATQPSSYNIRWTGNPHTAMGLAGHIGGHIANYLQECRDEPA